MDIIQVHKVGHFTIKTTHTPKKKHIRKGKHVPKIRFSEIEHVSICINGVREKLIHLTNDAINTLCASHSVQDDFVYRTDTPYDSYELWYLANYKLKARAFIE
jgi:hypothetical protein